MENENGVWYSYIELNIPPLPVEGPSIKTTHPSIITELIIETPQSSLTPNSESTQLYQPLNNSAVHSLSNCLLNRRLIGVIPAILIVVLILLISTYLNHRKS